MSSTGFSIAANGPVPSAMRVQARAPSNLYGDSEDEYQQNNTVLASQPPGTLTDRECGKQ
jgi:hypothetical protein